MNEGEGETRRNLWNSRKTEKEIEGDNDKRKRMNKCKEKRRAVKCTDFSTD